MMFDNGNTRNEKDISFPFLAKGGQWSMLDLYLRMMNLNIDCLLIFQVLPVSSLAN